MFLFENGTFLLENHMFLFGDDIIMVANGMFLFESDMFLFGNNMFLLENNTFRFEDDMFLFGDDISVCKLYVSVCAFARAHTNEVTMVLTTALPHTGRRPCTKILIYKRPLSKDRTLVKDRTLAKGRTTAHRGSAAKRLKALS